MFITPLSIVSWNTVGPNKQCLDNLSNLYTYSYLLLQLFLYNQTWYVPEMQNLNAKFIYNKARGWSKEIKTAFPKNEKKKYKIL